MMAKRDAGEIGGFEETGDLGAPPAKAPRTGGVRDGDWICPACGNNNFADRMVCNMRKCGAPRPGVGQFFQQIPMQMMQMQAQMQQAQMQQAMPMRQDWTCPACGNNNFADRMVCNMRKCGAPRPSWTGGEADAFTQMQGGGAAGVGGGDMWGGGACAGGATESWQETLPITMQSMAGSVMNAMGPCMGGGKGMGKGGKGRLPDWVCVQCGNRNFGDRTVCNMRKCSAPRPMEDWMLSWT